MWIKNYTTKISRAALSWYQKTIPQTIQRDIEHYLSLMFSGTLIALTLWAFELLENPDIIKAIKRTTENIINHATHPPIELVVAGWFILSLSIMATSTWGKILRKYAVKPLNELFIHTIGIASGIFIVIWLRDPASFEGETWLTNLIKLFAIELLTALATTISVIALKICETDLGDFLQNFTNDTELAKRISKAFDILSFPVGFYFMRACYLDLAKIGATITGIQH